MAKLSGAELRERLERELPLALADSGAQLPTPAAIHGPPPMVQESEDVLIVAERLIEAALYLRDTLGYSYLSDIAVVDFLAEDVFELVYRFYHLEGGAPLTLKLRVPRAAPDVPALTPHWPGANFHEREAFDLFGIHFVGHPALRRIYMWDEFEGFPMRKDFSKQGDKYIGDEE
ncbi:NADH-quinone oxidoreductase subunit C [Candidatus Gracilibacteria bacterium]|nr:NADH-quinone oxidoreductase subunit C [Candidatus Gracilibacteria bacterium]